MARITKMPVRLRIGNLPERIVGYIEVAPEDRGIDVTKNLAAFMQNLADEAAAQAERDAQGA